MIRALESFKRIPKQDLPGFVNKLVHVSWAPKGCVWRVESIDGEYVHLITPKTGKRLVAKASEICYTRAENPA